MVIESQIHLQYLLYNGQETNVYIYFAQWVILNKMVQKIGQKFIIWAFKRSMKFFSNFAPLCSTVCSGLYFIWVYVPNIFQKITTMKVKKNGPFRPFFFKKLNKWSKRKSISHSREFRDLPPSTIPKFVAHVKFFWGQTT